MYDSYGYGQPMMQQMQMRQNDWQQRMQARSAPRYEVIQVNGENGARAFAMAMAFIHDKDAVKNKTAAYYNHIVNG